jgi:sRNA-binding protein
MRYLKLSLLLMVTVWASAQENTNQNAFRQLNQDLPTPNSYRTASGAPGHEYWQQKADYKMEIRLDDDNQRIYGNETITYHNNSKDQLNYLWLQLDQNVRAKDSDSYKIRQSNLNERTSTRQLSRLSPEFEGGFNIDHVRGANGDDMTYVINKTMMRINLPTPLMPGQNVEFSIKYWYNINDRMKIGGRSGFEYFEEDDNYLYTIAQFFPRMCVYNEVDGWQNKQFLGRGEFTLSFGDYEVDLIVPADHLVSATGELQNPEEVLSKKQIKRYEQAKNAFEQPVMIVTQDEAQKNEKSRSKETKTWKFKADNVRDFAFASSRKFIWDAMAVKFGDRTVMAMSMYPKEGNPLWEQYSTKVVAHTLKWYSHYTFDYPYPVAWSIHTNRIGMEYPMICFNGGRPEADGTYSERTKYGMISVIIHEVGHNYFPMIVNSDERQWTWMDEGLTSFVQYLTEQQFQRDYPSRSGEAQKIAGYMGGDKSRISPIMTNSESIFQFGNNAYSKPATALNILRETVMGRELFDYAFKEYCNRWMFKQPTPADFFRTMEDASGVDLDWFWRGWFFTNDHVDMAIAEVNWKKADELDPKLKSEQAKAARAEKPRNISSIRNEESIKQTYTEKDPSLNDFYSTYDPLDVTDEEIDQFEKELNSMDTDEKEILEKGMNYYEISFEKVGGLVMPIVFNFEYTDGTIETVRIPAEIWRFNDSIVTKVFPREKEIKRIVLDPYLETADVDTRNNYYPPQPEQPDRFEIFKQGQRMSGRLNPMQKAAVKKKVIKP